MSIRWNRGSWWLLALVIAAVGVAPLASLAYLVESRATDSVRSEVHQRLSGTAALTGLFLDEQVRGVEEVVVSYARRRRLLEALAVPGGPDVAELDRQMRELQEARGGLLNVAGIADLSGTMIASTVTQPPGASFGDREWHQTVRRTGKPYVSEALVGRSPGRPLAISIAAPVVEPGGRVVAIIVVGYTLEELQQYVDTFVLENGTDVTVTDQAGVVLAQPGAPPTELVSRASDPPTARALAGGSGIADDARTADGQRALLAYAPVPRLGWTVTAALPRSDAYAQVGALQSRVRSITLALAGLFMLGSAVLARSVLARRAAERAQRRVSDQLARVIDISPVPTVITRVADGRILLANAAMLRTLGWEADEVIGRTTGDIRLWPSPGNRRSMLEKLRSEGRIYQMEERLRRRDGTLFDVITSIEVVEFDGDQCLLGLFYDITERVRAERALRAYSLMFQHASDGVLFTSPTGEIHSANPAACDILQMSEDEICRGGRSGLADPTDERWRAAVADRDRDGRFRGEVRMRRGDGSTFVADVSTAIFDDELGKQRATVMFRDVSDRTALIEEKARAAEAAEAASRLKSEFVATMSHEVRTPMNGLIGMTRLLLDTDLTAEQRNYAETVRGSAESLLTILNDVLDLSKIEAGRLELEEVDFDLPAVVEEVAELLATAAHDKGLELVVRIDPDLHGMYRGDPGRVRQIVMNLVGNAIKFTDRGVVHLHVGAVREHDTDRARFELRDTGVGIAPEAQGHLFESFVQADAATTRRFGGTGLGLAICKRLVELMDGDIGVESSLGEGSTFWFEIPLGRSAAPAPRPPEVLVGLRALVVDEASATREALTAQLGAWGITTTAVTSAETAMATLRRATDPAERFDIVLSDLEVPGMGGLELADAIAQVVTDPPPVILLTTAGGRDSGSDRSSGHVARFLLKPARRSHLFDAIATALGKPTWRRDTAAAAEPAHPRVGGGRLLVVDDNEVNQRLAVVLLQKAGYRVDAVDDGAQAVEAVRGGGYDAVLMDCEMPVMDGYTAAAEIRRHEAGRGRVPIIAVSASAMKGDVERALAAGMDAHVAKPIDLDDLARVLRQLLDG